MPDPKNPIQVTLKDGKVDVKPDRKSYPPGDFEIVWKAAPQLEITDIRFEGPHPPITDLRQVEKGRWTARNNNDLKPGASPESFKYSVFVRQDGQDFEVDPEIVNRPTPDGG